jgi:hypothetical protein
MEYVLIIRFHIPYLDNVELILFLFWITSRYALDNYYNTVLSLVLKQIRGKFLLAIGEITISTTPKQNQPPQNSDTTHAPRAYVHRVRYTGGYCPSRVGRII